MREPRQHVSIAAQIAEAEKAFALRAREISKDIASGKMRQPVGALHLMHLQAARDTLLWLERHEAAIKAKVADAAGGRS